MTPDQQQVIDQYVRSMRGRGYNDQAIREALKQSGWSEELLGEAFAETEVVTSAQFPSEQARSSKKGKKIIFLLPALLLIGGLAAGGLIFIPNYLQSRQPATEQPAAQPEPEVSLTQLQDPNFTMQVPASWSLDADYKPGAGIVTLYSPELSIKNLAERSASMRILSKVEKKPGEDKDTRINQQISSIRAAGGSVVVISDDVEDFADQTGRVVEVTITTKESPNKKVRLLSASVETKDYFYYIDISGLEEHWDLHRETVRKSVQSFEPLSLSKTP